MIDPTFLLGLFTGLVLGIGLERFVLRPLVEARFIHLRRPSFRRRHGGR